jgi:hypothetical protein
VKLFAGAFHQQAGPSLRHDDPATGPISICPISIWQSEFVAPFLRGEI